ncbi:MAG TPA: cupin domain-containing protein [bacterium]|nr:cupin domain-containing protein [bacterium]
MRNMLLVMAMLALGGCAAVAPAACPDGGPEAVIRALQLMPMPDDACPGYWRPTYAAAATVTTPAGPRAASSLIYYLMTDAAPVDPWHRLQSDEVLLYHAGVPLTQLLLHPDGTWAEVTLGPDLAAGQVPQQVIPAGTWMGFVKNGAPGSWGLYSVLVSPGFDLADQELARTPAQLAGLRAQYPAAVARATELGLFPAGGFTAE